MKTKNHGLSAATKASIKSLHQGVSRLQGGCTIKISVKGSTSPLNVFHPGLHPPHIMSNYMGDARTAVLVSFPFNPVRKIVGEPSNPKVSKWFRQMCSNLISVNASLKVGRGKGHLGMLQQEEVFQAQNGQAYNLLVSDFVFPCWNLIPDYLDQVDSLMNSNAIYYFEFQTWNLALQPA